MSARPGLSRAFLRQLQFTLDFAVLGAAFVLAYAVRFEFSFRPADAAACVAQLPLVVLVQFLALLLAGVYRFIWRYVGIRESRAFLRASLGSAAVLAAIRFFAPDRLDILRVPLSVIVTGTVFAFGGVLALRVLRRVAYERGRHAEDRRAQPPGEKHAVLLVGAGQAGVLAAREILGRGDIDLDVKGFVDDDVCKLGAVIQGIRVLGTTRDIPRLVREHAVGQVVITIARIRRDEILRLLEVCRSIPVKVRIVPGLYEVLQGKVKVTRIRDVEIEDLLGRDRVQLDEQMIGEYLRGRTVMVTGAGGSIGSELVRQIARWRPERILLVERAEFALFSIEREAARLFPDVCVVPLVADVGDEPRMRSVFSEYRPDVVLHAAAHKHVPMMETNPAEAIKNNVGGTRLTGELAGEFGAESFVLISTDKAVRPTSVMGASKRIAELVVQDLAKRYATRFLAVRFGNVMGSVGSVIPIFREQIRRGGPLTVTHPEMKRYFMTIPEATQLVLQAGAMGRGGEIFVLDMGEPVRILDIAEQMIALTGLTPYEDMDIVFTGLRPGEKLFEELEMTDEKMEKTRHPRIFIGRLASWPHEQVVASVAELDRLAREGRGDAVRERLSACLPESKLAPHSPEETAVAEPRRRNVSRFPTIARPEVPAALAGRPFPG
ncbi:MAG TPA: nucleoside-diphosphate sugar epimerase/dehydratase [Thermoanaerobaculia bacterium]|nr:nucleoside-diphosphate sugar epimerase/dehydratase [Thermoanaerobaculia bacterium]